MSHPSLSHIELECQESFIQGKIHIQKLSFRELCDSKLSGLHPFDKMVVTHWVKNRSKTKSQKQKSRLCVHETQIFEVIFVTLTENSSVVKYDT